MSLANTNQNFQDWCTQQWVIITGRKWQPENEKWLQGPYGETKGIGEDFIQQLANKEQLIIHRNCKNRGLLSTIYDLKLSENELNTLSKKVIDFYENTSNYQLELKVKWNPFFKFWGLLVNKMFSQRINQLNIPIKTIPSKEKISNEIITLNNPTTNEVKYTIWLRKFESTGKVIYSGIYTTTTLPSGKTCIKAIFPLPKGNATVILEPTIGGNHELVLNSSGKNFGDSGFYFLLQDGKENHWAKYLSSFTDRLTVENDQSNLIAKQILKLWKLKVVEFNYTIKQ